MDAQIELSKYTVITLNTNCNTERIQAKIWHKYRRKTHLVIIQSAKYGVGVGEDGYDIHKNY